MLRAASIVEPVLQGGLLVVLFCLAAIVVASLAYSLFLLVTASIEASRRRRAAKSDPGGASPQTRFLILVPAHDEELVLPSTLAALSQVDYPGKLKRVVVIADNCSDRTADL